MGNKKSAKPSTPGEPYGITSRLGLGIPFWIVSLMLLVCVPLLNLLPSDSVFHVSDFTLNLFGKFFAFAILALGIDLIWGYTGVLSLGHGVFFGLGAYAIGMHLMLGIGAEGVYGNDLPDFMVWNQVTELPWFWKPFSSFRFSILAVILAPMVFAGLFGFLVFRSRIRGVYFSIITQALALVAWLVFNRNETNLGGTNGLTDFKHILGYPLNDPGTQRGLYILTVFFLGTTYLLCRRITQSRAGGVLIAIRDCEQRVLFSGYSPANFKLFVFVISAGLAGIAGALYVPQVGIITPNQIGVLPSIEMAIWVAVGGRGTLTGAIVGAVGVNWTRSFLTNHFPELWPFFLGGLFIAVVMFFPKGVVGLLNRLWSMMSRRKPNSMPPKIPQTAK